MAAKTISLRELRNHVKQLDRLVTDAWFNSGVPAQISFADVRKHAAAISALVADGSTSPHAASPQWRNAQPMRPPPLTVRRSA